MVMKRKFEFPCYDGLVDIYLDGMKTHAGHSGRHGHIYLHISENKSPKIEIAPHDPRIGMEAEIKDGKVVPLVIERKMISDINVTVKSDPSKVAQEVMREIKRESRRQTFDLGKSHTCDDKEPLVDKAVKVIPNPAFRKPGGIASPVNDNVKAKSKVGFSQEATVEVVKSLKDK